MSMAGTAKSPPLVPKYKPVLFKSWSTTEELLTVNFTVLAILGGKRLILKLVQQPVAQEGY